MMTSLFRAGLLALAIAGPAAAQQVPDSAFAPPIARPAFAVGAGPVVAVDAAHTNFHTPDGRYLTFATLLRRDGFTVTANAWPWSTEALAGIRVLVVANALHRSNDTTWALPTPSAFTPEEIAAVRRWVEQGGSLFLIADHMPFAGAATELGAAFGITFTNGFAVDTTLGNPGTLVFRRADGSLRASPIIEGRGAEERVDSVVTFTGSAFQVGADATPVLVFGPAARSLNPDTAWAFSDRTPRVDVGGWSQGALLRVGRGRVAVFGEAAMFSAQLAGPNRRPVGMNAPVAAQNPQFLLNIVHWLAGALGGG
jgi:hypothetical protein